jgi:cobalt-zinc-cadmium efflux system protein
MKHSHNPKHHLSTGHALSFTLVLTFVVMLLEFIYGWLSGSLALISDALHMASHSIAAVVSLIAYVIAKKPSTIEKTYGFQRSEVLAALLNGFILIPLGLWIIFESYERYLHPKQIQSIEMLIVAIIGLLTNAATLWILHLPSKRNLNMQSVVYHILGDLLSSVAVVLAALLIYFKSWYWVDPLVSVLISVLILIWGISTILKSTHILMEGKPKHIKLDAVHQTLHSDVPGCVSIHDLHIWEITQDEIMLTAHIVTKEPKIETLQLKAKEINQSLKDKFGIGHVTLQYETTECGHTHTETYKK